MRRAYFGSEPSQVAQIRSWCQHGARVPANRTFALVIVVSELATNALTHSASGLAGGHICVEMEALAVRLIRIAVTDDGPRPGQPIRFPTLPSEGDALTVCGRGLRLVERLSTTWGWEGEPGRPLTVWAHIDPYAPVPETAEA
ncbi:ATP-binding protein [Nocardiopsis sp. FR6]|uniref:ATP-binding protein n=1 Tax=Nocardiopsis sp. FR6 TaxID=2605986 RepID=UPI001358E98D|nr:MULTISPECIES: ATP-binding protein [unclassified Nocardiopsis]